MENYASLILMNALRNARPSRKTEARIRERIQKGLCIIEGCNCKYSGHGLCVRHDNAFKYQRTAKAAKFGRAESEKWELRQYTIGNALPNQMQREYARKEDVA